MLRTSGKIVTVFLISLLPLQALGAGTLKEEAQAQSMTCHTLMKYLETEKNGLKDSGSPEKFQHLLAALENESRRMLKEARTKDEKALVKFILHCLAQLRSFSSFENSRELQIRLLHSIEETDQLLMASTQ